MARKRFSSSFTLLELLLVVGLLSVLATVTFISLNPVDQLKKSRDARRAVELDALEKALRMYTLDQPNGSVGTANTVYLSLPDTSSTCSSWSLPPLPPGSSYQCVTEANLRNINGTGWIPVALASISYGSPLPKLPVDPVNNATYYYTYVPGGSFMITALTEQATPPQAAVSDGGRMPGVIEKGTDLSLGPFTRDNGLVGYWTFDEGTGTTAYDYSGKGNNGTLINGPTWQSGATCKKGGCLQFNGTNNCIDAGNNATMQIPSDITISLWINPTLGTREVLIDKGYNGAFRLGFIVETAPYGIYWFHGDGTNSIQGMIFNSTSVGWQNIVLVRDSVAKKYYAYRNGVFLAANGYSLMPVNTSHRVYLGCRDGSSEYFAGIFDDVRIYNRALSADEIRAIYDATK